VTGAHSGVPYAWDVYWRRDITEEDIQHEIDREHSRG